MAGSTPRVVAENVGQAVVKLVLSVGGGSIDGIVIDRTAPNAAATAQIRVTAGVETITAVSFIGTYYGPGTSEGLLIRGSARATLRPGSVTDYTAGTIALGPTSGQTPFIRVQDSATFLVDGGTFGGPGLGASATGPSNGVAAAVVVEDTGALTLRGVTLSFKGAGAAIIGDASLRLENATLRCSSAGATLAAVHLQRAGIAGGTPHLEMVGSHLDVAGCASTFGVRVYDATTSASVTIDTSVIDGAQQGIWSSGALTLVATNSTVQNNPYGGIKCDGACSIDWTGGAITGNASGGSAVSPFGGLWLGSTSAVNHLRLRGATVTGNKGMVGNVGIDRNDNSGIVLKGAPGSTYDLGTAADPGANVLRDNTQGASTSNLWLSSAGVTALAVGNTWDASTQGTNASGAFVLGAGPCGAIAPCDATSGAGANYRVSAGALRLLE